MSELEELRTRKEARMDHVVGAQERQMGDPRAQLWIEAEHDLERTLELAEGAILQLDWWLAENTLEVVCECGNRFNTAKLVVKSNKERDEARAAVLALRDEWLPLSTMGHNEMTSMYEGMCNEEVAKLVTKWLADTQSYEQYR